MKKTMTTLLAAIVTVTTLAGCSKANNSADAAYLKDMDLSKYVTLGEYKGVTVEVESPEVADTEVDSYLQYVASSMEASVEVTDRPVQEGDTVNIDYAGKYADSGEAFDGGTAQGYDLVIGSGQFIDGFEDGLIGANTGDTLDLNLTFPEEYGNADLAGVNVVFTVTVNKISVKPDLDDAYAASLGIENVSNLEELKTYIKGKLLEEAQSTYDSEVQTKVIEAVTNGCMFENPPQPMLDRFKTIYESEATTLSAYYASNYGTSFSTDDIFNMLMSQEGYSGELEDYKASKALDLAKQYVMLAAIAEKESIEVSDEELEERLNSDMATANSTAAEGASFDSLDAYKETIDVEAVKENLLIKKATEFLTQNANVVEPTGDAESTEETGDAEAAEDAATEDAEAAETTEETAVEEEATENSEDATAEDAESTDAAADTAEEAENTDDAAADSSQETDDSSAEESTSDEG